MRRHVLDRPIFYYAIYVSVRCIPVRLCRFLGKVVALVVYAFSHRDREGFALNLSMALNRPVDDPLVRSTIRRIFTNYGQYMVDFFLMPQLPLHKTARFLDHLKGEDVLQRALAKGRGAILLSGHVGNWEFGGTMMQLAHYPLTVVALAHNTPSTNALVNKLRRSKGIQVIEVDGSPFSGIEILQHLRANGIVAMMGDKDFFGHGLPVEFLGVQVHFPVGPVLLAMKSGAALIPTFVLKQPDGRYFGVLEEPIPLVLEGNREWVVKENLSRTARIMETYVRRYPDQWYCPDPIFERPRS